MPRSQQFNIGFTISDTSEEHLFLSVSRGFEHGPGIQRDGISSPRMTDPHSVDAVTNALRIDTSSIPLLRPTTDPFIQRAGTWTLYDHLRTFVQTHGDNWRIVGVQSNGDLTMNFWHIAFLNHSSNGGRTHLCGLRTLGDPQENFARRTYRCLIKWQDQAAAILGRRYDSLELRFSPLPDERWMVKLARPHQAEAIEDKLQSLDGYDSTVHDVGPFMEFALSGKPIVEDGVEITLANAIDRFEDVRHIFNLPAVAASGHFDGHHVSKVNFGEYQLFRNVNERRAALSSPVVIDLKLGSWVTSDWDVVRNVLLKRHYRETGESPTRRGEFRRYSDREVEIFFPHNVYPFGVLGIRPSETEPAGGRHIVSLSSGGLSGRVGNTLEGITQIMFDFFGCTDAMVLDEGYDVFSLVNPAENGTFRYTNKDFLSRVLSFTKDRVDKDASEALISAAGYPLGSDMKDWPLNRSLLSELDTAFSNHGPVDYSDVVVVPPHRSQMRSVLILAVRDKP